MSWAILQFPPAPGWSHQAAYETVFGGTWRIAPASLVAYFCGEFCNSFVLAKMKIWSSGRNLWMRTIGSTIAGELVDSLVFYPLAFLGIWTTEQVLEVLLTNYALKVGWEAVMTPFTYRIVNFLKRAEREDYFDRNTDFTPFSLRTRRLTPHGRSLPRLDLRTRSAAHEEPDLRGSAPGAPGAVVPVRAAPREAARGRRARHRRQARGVRALLRGSSTSSPCARSCGRRCGLARAAHDRGPRLRNRGRGSGLGPGGGRRHARGGDRPQRLGRGRGPRTFARLGVCGARRGAATCWAARCPAREPGSSARTPRTSSGGDARGPARPLARRGAGEAHASSSSSRSPAGSRRGGRRGRRRSRRPVRTVRRVAVPRRAAAAPMLLDRAAPSTIGS